MTPLEDIIFNHIARGLLERVVYDQNIVDENTRRSFFKDPDLPAKEVVDRTVSAYGPKKSRLAFGLYEQKYLTDWETAKLLYPHFSNDPDDDHLQASLVQRAPDLPANGLNTFLDEVRGHVCLIVCRKGLTGGVSRGTGFLIAPDLVLTCRHVFNKFNNLPPALSNGDTVEIYFDFYVGDPVEDLGADLPDARKVGVASSWYVESGNAPRSDGIADENFQETQRAEISSSLDFILLRLDQKVGMQPIQRSGGRRRKWIDLAPDTVPQGLRYDDRIIIPQHPGGKPMRIDFGRFREIDKTDTRIRYSTSSAKGTSGAPCFNQNFKLVGLHNAYVGPEAAPLANQAIRFDHIAAKVRPHLVNLNQASAHTRRWSVAPPGEAPQVILGRAPLLTWLERALSVETKSLSERVYVAQAAVPEAGCSFSLDMLHAEIRGSKIPRCVYGRAGQQLPPTAEDFLKSLLRELEIDWDKLPNPMPHRPGAAPASADGPALPAEVDKLERWLSVELPVWLGDVISTHVVAPSTEPRPDRWPCAFVVIDDLRTPSYQGQGPRTTFTQEVRNLIAALV
jgi:hypothetical protein